MKAEHLVYFLIFKYLWRLEPTTDLGVIYIYITMKIRIAN